MIKAGQLLSCCGSSSGPEIKSSVWNLEIILGPDEYGTFDGFPLWLFDPLQVLNHAIETASSFVMEFKENELESISLNVERLLVVGGLK